MSRRITCTACGRVATHGGHGWCDACYKRWRKAGCPKGGPPQPREPLPCGTTAAWQRHRRHGEPIDAACRDAWNAACRDAGQRYRTRTVVSKPRGAARTDRDAEIRRIAQIGLTEQQIADEIGCPASTVRRVLAAAP